MAQYAYKFISGLTDTQLKNGEATLNTQGAKGWEVVSVIHLATDDNLVIAKRQIS